MQRDSERLDERTAGIGHAVRERVAHIRWVVCALHQRAVEVGEDFRRAAELHGFADVVAALFAQCAGATWEADFQCDAVADFEGCHGAAGGCYRAGGFVAQTHWCPDNEVAIAAVAVVV